MLLDDTAVAKCGLPDELASGLDTFLDAQPPVTEADIDAMFVAEMEHRDHQAIGRDAVRTVAAFAA